MGYSDTMDIRGIAWAGYFFSPSGVITNTEFICVDVPEMDADELIPVMADADEQALVPIITDADADTPC